MNVGCRFLDKKMLCSFRIGNRFPLLQFTLSECPSIRLCHYLNKGVNLHQIEQPIQNEHSFKQTSWTVQKLYE